MLIARLNSYFHGLKFNLFKMKKITLLLTVFSGLFLNAQSYYQAPIGTGNPGGLNADNEYPVGGGLATTWSLILGPNNAIPKWSVAQTIPFTFLFNGVAESTFKVSSTGVLTFDTSAVSVPGATNVAIPSANIPNKSVMIWGINGTGATDNISKKVFGTAPNRQMWVFFTSYTMGSNSSTWSYWSIVMEETTNKIYIVDQRNANGTLAATAGIQVDSTTAFSVAGSPSLGHLSGQDFTPADNFYYTFIPGPQPAFDLAGNQVIMNDVELLSSAPFSINAKFFNSGSTPITGLTINYKVNGGTTVSSSLTGLNIGTSQLSNTITHPTSWTPASSGQFTIKVWADALNGTNADEKNENDTIVKSIIVVINSSNRMVVIEEKTGTWCGWCPRGTVGMNFMNTTYKSTTATIAVHNQDPMVETTYNAGIGTVAPGGYPGSAVDRVLGPDPSSAELTLAYNARMAVPAYVDVLTPEFVSYDWATATLQIKVRAKFAATLTGKFNMVLVLTEDHVVGTASNFGQENYYSYQSQNLPLVGAGHNWQQEPKLVPASTMSYDHVARAILDGFAGNSTVIPGNVVAGTVYEKTFTYTLKGTENIMNFTAVAMVTNRDNYEILNANKVEISSVIGIQEVSKIGNLKVYPNPATNFTSVNIDMDHDATASVSLTNTLGQVVSNVVTKLESGNNKVDFTTSGMAAGIYFVKVEIEGVTQTVKLTIQ